ncbi:hypothetical protein MH117_09825 [Paenibacillus sp. ACRRX]|uniref:hypothetical protein n=1 Tax=Paenibacillus sp. ACRRX TaxID=2918206 RepID=UPI001EF48618|nr:hypothetical protein [Paenibacillus sp. ACRRX]MCG7407721.1 hypothetical protein [Paenibacillus sp. ACRRX]
MDILNTFGGDPETALSLGGFINGMFIVAGVAILASSAESKNGKGAFLGFLIVLIGLPILLSGVGVKETGEFTPIRHEVMLRDGQVIDATKYEIVEQRGKIYVIQEREASE